MAGKITEATKKNAVAKNKKTATMKDYVEKMMPEIEMALPKVMTPERFARITMTALSSNPQLQETTPQSFLGAMMTAAQLGLEPNTPLGQAYLIPYKNKGTLECQFQLGYKGLIDLAYRSGEVKIIQAHAVFEKDTFEYELGLDPTLKHIPSADADRGTPVFYYAIFKTKDGGYGFEVMSIDDVKKHAGKYSQSYNSSYSPWKKSFDEMAKKTVLKKVLKYAPLKTDFVKAVGADEAIKSYNAGSDVSILDQENEVDFEYEINEVTGEILNDEPTPEEQQAIIDQELKESGEA